MPILYTPNSSFSICTSSIYHRHVGPSSIATVDTSAIDRVQVVVTCQDISKHVVNVRALETPE